MKPTEVKEVEEYEEVKVGECPRAASLCWPSTEGHMGSANTLGYLPIAPLN